MIRMSSLLGSSRESTVVVRVLFFAVVVRSYFINIRQLREVDAD